MRSSLAILTAAVAASPAAAVAWWPTWSAPSLGPTETKSWPTETKPWPTSTPVLSLSWSYPTTTPVSVPLSLSLSVPATSTSESSTTTTTSTSTSTLITSAETQTLTITTTCSTGVASESLSLSSATVVPVPYTNSTSAIVSLVTSAPTAPVVVPTGGVYPSPSIILANGAAARGNVEWGVGSVVVGALVVIVGMM